MKYRHKWYQFLKKRLNVPKRVESQIYSNHLSLANYIEYELYGKVPLECLNERDRKILEKFGLEKIINLDWELILTPFGHNIHIDFFDILEKIPEQEEKINDVLYEVLLETIPPERYSQKMKELYQDRYFEIKSEEEYDIRRIKKRYNEGFASLEDIVSNWDMFKDKRFSYHLNNDSQNSYNLTEQDIREFMEKYEVLGKLIVKYEDVYKFIYEHNIIKNESHKREFIKKFTDLLLEKSNKENGWSWEQLELTNEEYKIIFKYSSLEEELKRVDEYYSSLLMKEVHDLSPDYIFNSKIPFKLLKDRKVLSFLAVYGYQNTIEFDNECGNFFTKNDFRILKNMFETYMHYSHNAKDELSFYLRDGKKENGVYTKDAFYETIRRMLLNGPTNYDYSEFAPNYGDMQGSFRERFPEMFIDENVPQELQDAFYTKSISPSLIKKHYKYIESLRGKDLSACFKKNIARQKTDHGWLDLVDLYGKLEDNLTFDEFMEYILEYADILQKYVDMPAYERGSKIELIFEKDISLDSVKTSTNELFKKLLIYKNMEYPENLPKHLKDNMKGIFLPDEAPEELKEMFYERKLNKSVFVSHPEYRKYFNDMDLEVLCKPILIWSHRNNGRNVQISIVKEIENKFGDSSVDTILYYGDFLEKMSYDGEIIKFDHKESYTKEDIQEELDRRVFDLITSGKTKYTSFMSESFKAKHPYMFLDENVDKEIQSKFYNREFTPEDFINNEELLNIFGNTSVICGMNEEYAWLMPILVDNDNPKQANIDRIKVVSSFKKIKDVKLQDAFKEYVVECSKEIEIEKLNYIAEVLHRLSISNSQEMVTFRKELATQILRSDDPIESLNKIESIFIKNNIPTVGKIYSCFEILHPNFQGFNLTENSSISPVLLNSTNQARKAIVFADLIKASFGSNNRSINNYLKNIEYAYTLYENIMSKEIKYDELDEYSKKELETFLNHLITMYSNTHLGKKEKNIFIKTNDVISDITELKRLLSPYGNMDYNLADRVVNMFCHFAGIETLGEAKKYIEDKIKTAEERNIEASKRDMILEEGDFVKGISGGIAYLGNILQNGSVSKEYLGASATSDATPLDTDVSRIMKSEGTNKDKLMQTIANTFGDVWFVLKNDDRFQTTRGAKEESPVRMKDKLEVFETGGNGHYGIRTGFASSDINYIMLEIYDERVALEIVKNGFYIPIANKDGKIIFSYEDYKKLQSKMNGLSYFNQNEYKFSDNLVSQGTEMFASQIEESNREVYAKKSKINELIIEALKEVNLELKMTIDGDLSEGTVELIDTGSTGRGTNKPGDGDFDFIMRVDRKLISNPEELEKLKKALLSKLNRTNSEGIIASGDFRLKDVRIDPKTLVDIDITFVEKTDHLRYSTDMCLQDRLQTIYNQDQEKYKYVISNILLAKKILKEANAYKPYRSDSNQGGLGGVGIENWILQNGGSFIDAARSFVEAANGKTWDEFKDIYKVWDFGENHLAVKKGVFPHDNFVYNNMSKEGYEKMTEALKKYIKQYEQEQIKGRRR